MVARTFLRNGHHCRSSSRLRYEFLIELTATQCSFRSHKEIKAARYFYLSSDTRKLTFSRIENSGAEENVAHIFLYLMLQYIRYINHNI